MPPTPESMAHDPSVFFVWALIAVCIALAGLATAVIRWTITHLEKKEAECKAERAEDQKQFLSALATRDTHMSALTTLVQETNKIVIKHDEKMDTKHSVEVETIAKLAGEAAVLKYRRENPVG